ncbi:MAG TPA: hypothetical protein VNE61_00865 [Ktedonobacteraceae bacterium]|nr:hypothetical protein [Ktedonobacteraceae bacterium]
MDNEQPRGVPSCPLTAHCLRLQDVLEHNAALDDEPAERALIAELRGHVPHCPTCSAALAQTRAVRNQQRAAFVGLLEEGERRVPATVERIQHAIRREAQTRQSLPIGDMPTQRIEMVGGQRRARRDQHSAARLVNPRRTIVWRNVAAAAMAAVVILAATVLFSHRSLLPGGGPAVQPTTTTQVQHQTVSPTQSTASDLSSTPSATKSPGSALFGGWNAAMIAAPSGNSGLYAVKNYNYTNGFSAALNSSPLPANTHFDGIPLDGQDLLYQYASSNHVYYARLLTPFANTGFFYELNADNAGNAIWTPDSRHVLINTKNMGIIEVDSVTGQETAFLPQLVAYELLAYHSDYLYYIGDNLDVDRVNVTTGAIQILTGHSMNSAIWISPDKTTLYWMNTGPAGQPGISAVNLTTLNTEFLRSSGEPVGFAADNALLTVQLINGQVQIVQVGMTPQQDQVVFANAAPGATSLCAATMATPGQICDNFIAMAPYGHAVIVQGTNADGSYHLWSDDLVTGQQLPLDAASGSHAAAQLLGWDRLSLPGS